MPVLTQEIGESGSPADDPVLIHSVKIERILANQRLQTLGVFAVSYRVGTCSNTLHARVCFYPNQCMFVSAAFGRFVIGVHRHELMEVTLQRRQADALDLCRGFGSSQ